MLRVEAEVRAPSGNKLLSPMRARALSGFLWNCRGILRAHRSAAADPRAERSMSARRRCGVPWSGGGPEPLPVRRPPGWSSWDPAPPPSPGFGAVFQSVLLAPLLLRTMSSELLHLL